MMRKRISIFGKILVHLIFCLTVVIFFGRNSVLRMAACNAPYKEYLTGFFVLCLFYLNMFVLFPQLVLKEKRIAYCLALLSCAFCWDGFELALVYPQINPALNSVFSPHEATLVFFHYAVFIFLRNICFELAAFALCDIRHLTFLKEKYESRLRTTAQEMDVIAREGKSEYIHPKNILFCQQGKNQTWIRMEGDYVVSRYGSLTKMMRLLGKNCVIFVSRDLFVMREKIIFF